MKAHPTFAAIKKAISFSLVASLVLMLGYSLAEPSFSYATTSATDSVVITLNVTSGISITSPSDSSMSTALGVSQNTAVGTTTWNVKTNSATGYTLALQATSSPAMQQDASNTVADYQTGSPNTWSVSNGSAFGYSVYGTDASTGTWGTGSTCGSATHVPSTTLKYKGFTTSPFTVETRTATTTTSGVDTTVCYAVEQNNFYIPSGVYTATITATATAS